MNWGEEREKEGGTRDPNVNFIELRRVIVSKCSCNCRAVSSRDANYSRAAVFTSGFAANENPSGSPFPFDDSNFPRGKHSFFERVPETR